MELGGFCFGIQFIPAAVITVVSPFVLGSIFKYWGFMGIDVFNLILADMLEFKIAFQGNGKAVMRRHNLWILFECQNGENHWHSTRDKSVDRELGGEAGVKH